MKKFYTTSVLLILSMAVLLSGCSSTDTELLPPGEGLNKTDYLIGPGDNLQIFVWRNPDLSTSVSVRPDGRISSPLIDDLDVANLKATDIARMIEQELSTYIRSPKVTVIVSNFNSTIDQQVRVIGNAANPRTIPFRVGMTLLDVMIEVQGLSEFADGDKAKLVRKVNGQDKTFTIHLDSLIKDGDISKNRPVYPGDTIIIPEAWF